MLRCVKEFPACVTKIFLGVNDEHLFDGHKCSAFDPDRFICSESDLGPNIIFEVDKFFTTQSRTSNSFMFAR